MNRNNDTLLPGGSAVLTAILAIVCFAWLPAAAQSTDQNFPTPITSNEITGEIRARDIGDSRLTTYYYIFRGERGDVFINVVTRNINGSIDVFSKPGLRPRTKVTLFADSRDNETGRVVYMRESELLILRIQGRSPNDDPGTYQLKFAGAFSAVAEASDRDPDPKVGNAGGVVRVNSVGTILPDPEPKEEVAAENETRRDVVEPVAEAVLPAAGAPEPEKVDNAETVTGEANKELNKAGREDADERTAPARVKRPAAGAAPTEPAVEGAMGDPAAAKEITVEINRESPERSALVTISREPVPAEEPTLEEQLAAVFLRISLKNGTLFSRPMNEVLSVNVIRGVLTVVTTDGRIEEFSILDVLKMTIE